MASCASADLLRVIAPRTAGASQLTLVAYLRSRPDDARPGSGDAHGVWPAPPRVLPHALVHEGAPAARPPLVAEPQRRRVPLVSFGRRSNPAGPGLSHVRPDLDLAPAPAPLSAPEPALRVRPAFELVARERRRTS
jgi:hypothetical protein